MSDPVTLATMTEPSQQTISPLHQPARDNSGNELPPLQAHVQKPDAPAPRRGVISDNAYHGLSPEDQGGSEWVARSELEADPANPADPAAPQGERFKIGQYEISEAELGAMMQRQAAEDLRRATIPATPEAYEAKLSDDFKMPAGVEFKFDANDPSMVAARNLAHAKGWSQQDFSEALGIFAGHVAGQEAALRARAQAEIAKAGVNAPQRVDAVGKFLDSFMGSADAKPLRATLVTDAHLRFYEKIMSQLAGQGTAPFSQQHRDRPEDGRVSDAVWENMSAGERLNYTRQFDQRQFNNPR
jgi:transcriptional regulator with XRE-family HTH domain